MKKLMILTMVAASAVVALTTKKSYFKVTYMGEDCIIVRDSNNQPQQWDIYKKNKHNYVFKHRNRAVFLPIDLKIGDTVELYNFL